MFDEEALAGHLSSEDRKRTGAYFTPRALVERTLDLVAEAMERGEIVKLSGFGVFQVREKRERMGRNPKTGEPATIAPRRVIGFRASQVLKARIDGALGG